MTIITLKVMITYWKISRLWTSEDLITFWKWCETCSGYRGYFEFSHNTRTLAPVWPLFMSASMLVQLTPTSNDSANYGVYTVSGDICFTEIPFIFVVEEPVKCSIMRYFLTVFSLSGESVVF